MSHETQSHAFLLFQEAETGSYPVSKFSFPVITPDGSLIGWSDNLSHAIASPQTLLPPPCSTGQIRPAGNRPAGNRSFEISVILDSYSLIEPGNSARAEDIPEQGFHSSKEKHWCNSCGRSFVSRYVLERHWKSSLRHRPLKQFKCRSCDKRFSRNDSRSVADRHALG
jgi:hypothetical protein